MTYCISPHFSCSKATVSLGSPPGRVKIAQLKIFWSGSCLLSWCGFTLCLSLSSPKGRYWDKEFRASSLFGGHPRQHSQGGEQCSGEGRKAKKWFFISKAIALDNRSFNFKTCQWFHFSQIHLLSYICINKAPWTQFYYLWFFSTSKVLLFLIIIYCFICIK